MKAAKKPTTHLVWTESWASASVVACIDAVDFAHTVTAGGGVILAAAAVAAAVASAH